LTSLGSAVGGLDFGGLVGSGILVKVAVGVDVVSFSIFAAGVQAIKTLIVRTMERT
jgi:hypothetical protein